MSLPGILKRVGLGVTGSVEMPFARSEALAGMKVRRTPRPKGSCRNEWKLTKNKEEKKTLILEIRIIKFIFSFTES